MLRPCFGSEVFVLGVLPGTLEPVSLGPGHDNIEFPVEFLVMHGMRNYIQSAFEMQQEGHAAHVKELRTSSKRRYKLK